MNIAQPKAFCSRRAVSAIALGLWFFGAISAYCGEPLADDRASSRDVQFVRDVQPILQRHCYSCHGESKQRSGLRLDVREAALRGGDGYGPSIIAGDVDSSPLIQLITADSSDERMPPEGDGLSPSEIETLTEWVRSGAEWPLGVDLAQLEDRLDHWAFKPLRTNYDQQSIDGFLLAKLEEQGLSFAAEADSDIWLRRVTFDLTGLPPTLEEIDEFQSRLRHANHIEDRLLVYRDVVEGLLSSERYGERWAQHWLDVVRYADTHGFEVNTERPNAWPYRDYVIRAFNQDTAYDQFIREQIVGDAVGQDAATGFLVTASVLLPGQIGKDAASIRLARQDALDEIVNNVSQTFIALSVGCARCHDHKFDPISAKDYYGMQALVAGVEYEEREIYSQEAEYLRRQTSALRERLDSIQDQLAGLSPIARPKAHDDQKPGAASLSLSVF
jgi:mono/diheme cytochrome c family protein